MKTKEQVIREYDIECRTNYGWEIVDCQPTNREARAAIELYRREQPGYEYRIKHHRVKKEG